jgi:hypothetical protein
MSPKFESPPQGGLAYEQAGQRAGGVHVRVGEHAHRLELRGVEQVRLVDDEDDLAAPLGRFGGERVGGLRDQGGVVEAGWLAERGDDGAVDASESPRIW